MMAAIKMDQGTKKLFPVFWKSHKLYLFLGDPPPSTGKKYNSVMIEIEFPNQFHRVGFGM